MLSGAGGWAPLALLGGSPGPRTALHTPLKEPACPMPVRVDFPSPETPGEERAAAPAPRRVPSLPLLPAPILSGSIENSAPGRTLHAGPGCPVRFAWSDAILPWAVGPRRGAPPLCRRDLPRWLQDANFFVRTCRFCCVLIVLEKLPRLGVGVTGIERNSNILKRTPELDTCVSFTCQEPRRYK